MPAAVHLWMGGFIITVHLFFGGSASISRGRINILPLRAFFPCSSPIIPYPPAMCSRTFRFWNLFNSLLMISCVFPEGGSSSRILMQFSSDTDKFGSASLRLTISVICPAFFLLLLLAFRSFKSLHRLIAGLSDILFSINKVRNC